MLGSKEAYIDENGQEFKRRGTPMFPCAFNQSEFRLGMLGGTPPHWHKELEIFLLDEGGVRITLIDQEAELRPGQGYFVNANALHGVTVLPERPCKFRSIIFDPVVIAGHPGSVFDLVYVRPFLEKGVRACFLEEGSPLTRLFAAAFQAFRENREGWEYEAQYGLARAVLLLRGREGELPAYPAARQEERMKQLLAWLEVHYREPVTMAEFAGAAGVCVRECQRMFAGFLHCSPMQYLLRRRVSAAAELLVATDAPVIEIGQQCGFEDPSYFAKQFKSVTGATPRAYRAANLAGTWRYHP